MTLIEVLAGLVVLGTVLAAVVVARGRFVRQWAAADRTVRATAAADALLARWSAGDPAAAWAVPVPAGGELPGAPGCYWRTTRRADAAAADLGSIVVRLDVFDRADPPAGRAPLVSVEILVPAPRGPGGAAPADADGRGHP